MLALRRNSVNIDIWFQQAGASPHTAGDVIQWLSQTFGVPLHFFQD